MLMVAMAALDHALVDRQGRGGEAAPQWSGLSTSNIAALASSVAIVVVAVIFLFTVVVCLYCCYRYRKRKSDEEESTVGMGSEVKGEFELLDVPSSKTEKKLHKIKLPLLKQSKPSSRAKSHPAVNKKEQAKINFLETDDEYKDATIVNSPDCGSRLQKIWTHLRLEQVSPEQQGVSYVDQMMSVMPLSQQCRIQLQNKKTLQKLLVSLQMCPYIHPMLRIWQDPDTNHVVMIQPYVARGSLKDYMYQCTPDMSWDSKYKKAKQKTYKKVAMYGRQILEALLFLRGIERFPSVGHVQSGNVFTEGDMCRVGGYESTLLGYKTRLHKLFKDNLDHIDVLMFGHLVFEMTCGYELTTTTPTSDDYKVIRKRSKESQDLTQALEFIFTSDSGRFPTIAEVAQLPLFCNTQVPHFNEWNDQKGKVTEKASKYLRKILK